LAIFDTVGDIQASAKVFSLMTPSIRQKREGEKGLRSSAAGLQGAGSVLVWLAGRSSHCHE